MHLQISIAENIGGEFSIFPCNEFWNRWRKEVLLSLQSRTKWDIPTRNCEVDIDIVLLKNEAEHNQGLMGNIVAIKRDGKGDV